MDDDESRQDDGAPDRREDDPDADGGRADGAADDRADEGRDPADESQRLSEEIREELEELDELRERHLRLAAEFENYRKRTRRELQEARDRGQAELAEGLLEALDDLARVLETPPDSTTAESLQEGVEMVQRKLEKELADAGLARMAPEGERFDPEYHEALLTTPADDPDENDQVSRVLINGYTFGDRVLRPARVEVKKYSEDDGEAGGGDGGGSGDGEGGENGGG